MAWSTLRMASAPSAWIPRVMTIRPPRWCLRSSSLSERTRSRSEVMMVSMKARSRTELRQARSFGEDRALAVASCPGRGGEGCSPRLDQRHQPALRLRVAFDVALRRLNRTMAGEELDIPQAPAGQSDLT